MAEQAMNVGIVSWLFPSDRWPTTGTFIRDQCAMLSAHVDVKIIAPMPLHRYTPLSPDVTAGLAIPVRRPIVLPFPRWFMQRMYTVSMGWGLIRERTFFADRDLVHVHNAWPEAVACARVFPEKPLVVTVHGADLNVFARKRALRDDIIVGLNRARRIICVSTALERTVRALGITTPTTVIHNGVDTALFSPGDRVEAARRCGLDPDRPRVLFVGNFIPIKGIEYLLEAFVRVRAAVPGCELVLVGARPDGRDAGLYRDRIAGAGGAGAVRLVENQPHEALPDWMRAADLLCLPSIAEGFGLVLAEAMACGRPVVATRCGGPEDIVVPGTGLLVPPRDPEALADAIVAVLGGDSLLDADAIAGTVRERFAWPVVIRRILGMYGDVLGRAGKDES